MTGQLPYTIADPEHILPWWLSLFFWALLLVLIYLLARKYLYPLLEKYMKSGKGRTKSSFTRSGMNISGIIKGILEINMKEKSYRKGLFQLSMNMKSHLEKKSGVQIEEMTAREILESYITEEPGNFFQRLESSAYKTEKPGKGDLEEMCKYAENITRMKLKTRTGPDF